MLLRRIQASSDLSEADRERAVLTFTAFNLNEGSLVERRRVIINTILDSFTDLSDDVVLEVLEAEGFRSVVEQLLKDFGDIGTLTLSACSALYIVAFVAKKLHGRCAKILGWIGRDSFYIMALHFIAFKICSAFLNVLGGASDTAVLEAPATNTLLYAYYTIGGVFVPLFFIYLWRHAINLCKRQID